MAVIELRRVTKSFDGVAALREVSFAASEGECLGLLGRNGAGKTTLLRIAAGLVRPTSGEVRLFGGPAARAKNLHDRIGVVHQYTSLPDFLTVDEYLRLEADLRGLSRKAVDESVTLGGIEAWRHARIGCLSEGSKRKLLLVRALMHRPRLLLLDEPTAGLDPLIREEVWQALEALRRGGMTILLATHDLVEAETLSTRILVFFAGELIADVNVRALREQGEQVRSSIRDLLGGPADLPETGKVIEWRN